MHLNPIVKNHVTVIGNSNKPTIIFAHGYGTDQNAWRYITDAYKDNYRLILYDNVGGGKSIPEAYSPALYNSLNSYANDLVDIAAALSLKDAIVIGHSVSGMVGLLATIKAPECFSKLALIGSSPRYINDDSYTGGFTQTDLDNLFQIMEQNYYAWVSGFAPVAMGNADKPELAADIAATLTELRPDVSLSVAKVIFQSECRQKLPLFSKEALILQTEKDIVVPKSVGDYLNKNISNSRKIDIATEGHFPHLSAPQEIISALNTFV